MSGQYAMCNELFDGPIGETAGYLAELGYTGIELAPYTFCQDVRDFSAVDRRSLKHEIEIAGLRVAGFHWLLAQTVGMHLCSAEPAQRRLALEYLLAEIDLCADLGGDILVLGSPAQRNPCSGVTFDTAWGWMKEAMACCAERADKQDVTFCIEALPGPECEFITCVDQAIELVEQVDKAGFGLMVDVKAMAHDTHSIADQIRLAGDRIQHVHVNDPNRLGPGMGDVSFAPIMSALDEIGYEGWLSVEAFVREVDPCDIARQSIRNLEIAKGVQASS